MLFVKKIYIYIYIYINHVEVTWAIDFFLANQIKATQFLLFFSHFPDTIHHLISSFFPFLSFFSRLSITPSSFPPSSELIPVTINGVELRRPPLISGELDLSSKGANDATVASFCVRAPNRPFLATTLVSLQPNLITQRIQLAKSGWTDAPGHPLSSRQLVLA